MTFQESNSSVEEAQDVPYRVILSSPGYQEVLSVRATKMADRSTVGQEGKWISRSPTSSSGIKEYVAFLRMPVEGKLSYR